MRKFLVIAIVLAAGLGAAAYFGVFSSEDTAAAGRGGGQQQAGGAQGGRGGAAPGGPRPQSQGGGPAVGGFGMPGGGGGGPRMPLTVEMASVKRGDLAAHLTVVGNLIGLQTVEVAPKTGGRLMTVSVQLGDRVRRGQVMAKIEDREIREQVNQAEASLEVSKATIRQREADLKVAELNFERSKNLFERQLLAKQSLDDAESKYLAAEAQIDLSKAQLNQTDARLRELRINLQNTTVTSPVDGFVGKRHVDPGAMVSQNQPVASVVEISRLKLIVNVVEKDLRLVDTGDTGDVEVDAYPGEKFRGRIARVAPVLDPATRTASMEVEIQNADNRLKPGMYARVSLVVEERKGALVAPKSAVIDFESRRGVWMPNDDRRARFVPVELGIEDAEQVEIKTGLNEGDRIVTTGATAVRNNDMLLIAGEAPTGGMGRPGGPAGAGRGGRGGADGARNSKGGQRPPAGQRPPQ